MTPMPFSAGYHFADYADKDGRRAIAAPPFTRYVYAIFADAIGFDAADASRHMMMPRGHTSASDIDDYADTPDDIDADAATCR